MTLSPSGPARLLRTMGRYVAGNPAGSLGLAIVVILVLCAVLAPLLAPHSPFSISQARKLRPPDGSHWLGTDQLGRDIFSRLIYGARPSLQVGLGAALLSLPFGLLIGLAAGYYRGSLLDQVLMRVMEILASIPLLVWAIAVIGIVGVRPIQLGALAITNDVKLILLLAVLYVPSLARITYAVAAAEARSDYVKARRLQGAGDAAIILVELLPNCLSPVIVQATLLVGAGIIIEASLSFIGLGVQPPQPSWGGMLAEARNFILGGDWWMAAFPGAAISLAVIGFNLLGDTVRDLMDPRRSRSLTLI